MIDICFSWNEDLIFSLFTTFSRVHWNAFGLLRVASFLNNPNSVIIWLIEISQEKVKALIIRKSFNKMKIFLRSLCFNVICAVNGILSKSSYQKQRNLQR